MRTSRGGRKGRHGTLRPLRSWRETPIVGVMAAGPTPVRANWRLRNHKSEVCKLQTASCQLHTSRRALIGGGVHLGALQNPCELAQNRLARLVVGFRAVEAAGHQFPRLLLRQHQKEFLVPPHTKLDVWHSARCSAPDSCAGLPVLVAHP